MEEHRRYSKLIYLLHVCSIWVLSVALTLNCLGLTALQVESYFTRWYPWEVSYQTRHFQSPLFPSPPNNDSSLCWPTQPKRADLETHNSSHHFRRWLLLNPSKLTIRRAPFAFETMKWQSPTGPMPGSDEWKVRISDWTMQNRHRI